MMMVTSTVPLSGDPGPAVIDSNDKIDTVDTMATVPGRRVLAPSSKTTGSLGASGLVIDRNSSLTLSRGKRKVLPALSRKAWVMLKVKKEPAIYFQLCFAELTGTHLVLSDVKGRENITADSQESFEVVAECYIKSFTYFSEQNRYFIEVRGKGHPEPIVFMTKNQADLTMKSSEVDFLNWQRMLAASLNIHLLEQKQYLLNPKSLPQDTWEALGRGSFGQVFKAKLNGITPVAVKRVSVEDMMTPGYADEKLHVDFINEALISCTVQGPCLLHFYGIFWDIPESLDAQVLDYYMVSELCEGGDVRSLLYESDDLGNILAPKPRLPNATIVHLLRELFSGLAYMHQRNVVHRDIKPDNIVLVRPLDQLGQLHHGIVKIIDYGHSRTIPEATKLRAGVLTANDRGTELYRAPETIATKSRSAEYSTKVDVYATGVIVWELWTRELPFTTQLSAAKQRISVEQLVASGERPIIPPDCPPGYVSLMSWCWTMDPKDRPNAQCALECIIEPDVFDPLPCVSQSEIITAVATGYWKRDNRLGDKLKIAMDGLRNATELVVDDFSLDCIGRFVELIKQNRHHQKHFMIPLEAMVVVLSQSDTKSPDIVDAIQACDGPSVLVMVLEEGENLSVEVCTQIFYLVAHLSRRDAGIEGWTSILPSVIQIMQDCSNASELQTLCIKFLSNICTVQAHSAALCTYPVITELILKAVQRFPNNKVLLAASARFLTLSPQSVESNIILWSSLKIVVEVLGGHIDDMPLQTLWIRLLSSMSINSLTAIEVVKVGVLPIVIESIKIHGHERPFCWSVITLLQKITSEPAHANQAVELGAIPLIFNFMETFPKDSEITLSSLVILSYFAQVPGLRKKLLDVGASKLFFSTLSNMSSNSRVQQECFKMACGIAHNPRLLSALVPIDQCDIILQSVEAFLHLEQFESLYHGLELLCLLLESTEHFDIFVQLKAPRVLVLALRICNKDQIPPLLMTAMKTICNDSVCAQQIVSARGIDIMTYALTNLENRSLYLPIVQCLTMMCRESNFIKNMASSISLLPTLGNLLRHEAMDPVIMEATLEIIYKLVDSGLCDEQYEASDINRLLKSLSGSLPEQSNTASLSKRILALSRNVDTEYNTSDSKTKGLSAKNESLFKIIVVGDTNVGKTCIVLRACKNTFSSKVKATLGVNIDFAEFEYGDDKATLQIFDTAGQEQYRSMTNQFYRGCHAALLVYDVNRIETFESLQSWLNEVNRFVDNNVVLAVVGSKCDLQTGRQVKQWKAERWARSIGATHYEVSAVANIGIHHLFRSLAERLLASEHRNDTQSGILLTLDSWKSNCSDCF